MNYFPNGCYTPSIYLTPGVTVDRKGNPWLPHNDPHNFASLQPASGTSQQRRQLPKEYQSVPVPPPPRCFSDLRRLESVADIGCGECGNRKCRKPSNTSTKKPLVGLGLYSKPEKPSTGRRSTKATMARRPQRSALKLEEAFDQPKFMKTTLSARDALIQKKFYVERLKEWRRTHGWWANALPSAQGQRYPGGMGR